MKGGLGRLAAEKGNICNDSCNRSTKQLKSQKSKNITGDIHTGIQKSMGKVEYLRGFCSAVLENKANLALTEPFEDS